VQGTPNDCRTCHQPDGPSAPKLLRMQVFTGPWTHWFWRQDPSGQAVLDDYAAAKGDEMFAGLTHDEIVKSQPGLVNFALFSVGSGTQPNEFVSTPIEQEVIESAPNQPTDNSVPGTSKTWDAIYETAKRGEAIPVPYHDVKVTDPTKLAAMTQAYSDYRAGKIDRQSLPDITDVYVTDPARRAEIGLDTEPGMDGQGVLLQACSQCHNDRMDQTLSRARFNVDLSKIGRAEKDKAIARLQLHEGEPHAMPPAPFRRLSDDARATLIAFLKR
jgi:mono/diheme cytochrome c family protein